MPALHHGGAADESAPPCACCHNLGDPSAFDPPYNFTSIKKTNELQAIHPPMCRGYVEKPFMGMNSYSSPYLNLQNGFHTIHSENSPVKPRIVTVVKPGTSALRKITLLLNRRSVQTFEQLIADISEALGFPRWKNDRVRKLYNLKGKEIGGISDFFRGDDVFIAMGLEPLTMNSIEMVTEELYPNGQCMHNTIKKHWRLAERAIGKSIDQSLKVDSGFEGSDISKDCCKAKSPRLAVRHEDKTQRNVRHTETVRVKKWDREKWHRQQGKPPEKLEKYPANSKNIKGKFEDRSLNDMVVCEQCRKERQSRHKLHNERPADVLLDVPNYNTGNCARYTLERKQKITSCKKPTGSPIAGYEFDRNGKECTSHRKPICGYPKELQKQHNEENLLDDSVEERNNHERHCIHIKNGTVEPQHNTTEGRTETEKQRESFCKMRAICKLSEDCQVDAQEPIKIRLEENMQGTQSNRVDNNIINTKSDLNGAYKNGGFKGTMERREQQQCSATGPRLLECRADVENYYEIGRIIGDGNFAIVKECRVRNVNQQYAMKIIDKSKLKGKEDMIENEISIIKGLSHPNIVRLLDEYETDTEIFLIMEYVRGGDLFDAIIESVRFTEHDAALMMADLCEALVYIHCRNIVHRDLKPENLLIQHNPDKSTTLKLADFGLAVHVTEPIFTVCGTPTYVAPEILLEKGYGLEVDMWATGVILYILLCGFPPFRSPERDQEHLFQIIQFGQYEFTSPYWDRISDEAKDLISKLLVVDPKWRFTAKQVLHHHWISSDGKKNSRNLQREVTMNIERHFQNRRRQEALNTDQ